MLAATSKSWRLPRQVNFDGADVNLAPNTWLVAEVDGSLALTVGARLGYEVSFSREHAAGLTRDLGATIDAKLKATFGVTASGSYLLMIGRESEGKDGQAPPAQAARSPASTSRSISTSA